MILGHKDVVNFKLYKYKTGYNTILRKKIKYLKQINRELKVGESAHLENSENKIKRINKDKYIFQRFDTISTHIENYDSDYNLNDVKNKLINKLDYNLKYGDDRIKLVTKLLEDNQWIYRLISTNRSIGKEIKKKNSFRSEEQPFDKLIEIISSYIYYAKFKNKEDEDEYKKKLKQLQDIQTKKKDVLDIALSKLVSEIQGYHHRLMKKQLKEDKRIEYSNNLSERENKGDFLNTEEQKYRQSKLKRNYKKDYIPESYWDELSYSEEENLNRKKILLQMESELNKLYKYIGLDIKDKDEREKHKKEIIKRINTSLSPEEKKIFNGKRQLGIITNMYNQLKGDYEIAKKLLTNEIEFKRLSKGTTEYDINSDTWYEDHQGNIIELSKNHILLSDKNTYKGLILNYKDLKDKYQNKMNHDIWALLFVFEELLNNTEFTQDEKFVLDMLFDNYNQKQIREKYENINLTTLTKDRISRIINNHIPNKLLNTYLNSMEDWLYTYKIKGKFKTCSKCGEIKLANERYFGKSPITKDGLQSVCKICDNLRK